MSPPPINDCFFHDKDRLCHDDALGILRKNLSPVTEAETVAIIEAVGRYAAEAPVSPYTIPASDNSAVDGYAFQVDGNQSETVWRPVVGRAAAGHPHLLPVPTDAAIRIFTGAVVPEGVNAVAMQEDCKTRETDGKLEVAIPVGLKVGANCRKAGEDVKAGQSMVEAGQRLRPQDIAALASTGFSSIACRKKLKVAVISSGDELTRPGRALQKGQVYDSNRAMLASMLHYFPVDITFPPILQDQFDLISENLSQLAQTQDLIITTGGASQGEEDHIHRALDSLGKRHMWQLAIKPGRPMMFGQIGHAIFLGLPGNPVAAFVCFLLYAIPVLQVLGGGQWLEPRRFMLPASFSVQKKEGRREFFRARVVSTEQGDVLEKFVRDGSGLISGLQAASGLAEIPEHVTQIKPGDRVNYIPFSAFYI